MVGAHSIVTSCIATGNLGDGIRANAGSVVTNCVAADNTVGGIHLQGSGGIVQGSTVRGSMMGLRASFGDSSITECAAVVNSTGILAPNSLIRGNLSVGNITADIASPPYERWAPRATGSERSAP